MPDQNIKPVGIFGAPRSGTTWLGWIFNSHPGVAYRTQPFFSYTFTETLDERSSKRDINDYFVKLLRTKDDYVLQKKMTETNHLLRFRKSDIPTHLVFKDTHYMNIIENMMRKHEDVQIVGIIRNPLSVLNSWSKAPKEFHPEWDLNKEWRKAELKNDGKVENYFGYEKWKEVVSLFHVLEKNYTGRFMIIRYSDLLKDPFGETEKLLTFAGLTYDPQTKDFVSHSTSIENKDTYGVFRKDQTDEQWKRFLPNTIIRAVTEDLQRSGLEHYLE